MGYFLSFISIILLLSGVGHAAALSAQEMYWSSHLPDVPMPQAIKDMLSEKGKGLGHAKGGGYGRPRHGSIFAKYSSKTNEILSSNDPNIALFFLEKDLFPGAKMKLAFPKTTSHPAFIPRQKADMVPFSSSKFPQILKHYSIAPDSEEAMRMKKAIEDCEAPEVSGEKKFCATSLESMVDFIISSHGADKVKAMSSIVSKDDTYQQEYTIKSFKVKSDMGNVLVTCHPEDYVHAVIYCHSTISAKLYTVEMVGSNGNKVEAVAACHADTKTWNPNYVAFKVLKVKPGTLPVCHFVPKDNVAWIRNT